METILNKIVNDKITEINERKTQIKESKLYDQIGFSRHTISLYDQTKNISHPWVISEFKRKSPSKPNIAINAQVEDIIPHYIKSGAMALSILTDKSYFGGSADDLVLARNLANIPILRKDFIIDPYQIIEAKALGADFILLIAEILTSTQIAEFANLAHECGLEVLLELHSESEIKKYHESIQFLGINNRDLKTFVTDIDTSIKLFPKLPSQPIKVSESGLKNVKDIEILSQCGYEGYLIGEHLMTADDTGLFMSQLKSISCK